MFESPYQVLVYPAGKCARKEHGKVTEQPWKKMFITQSRKYERDVVPVHMSGYNSKLFMFLTSFSKFIGLKFNIGMFMLVDELFKKQHKSFVITFGKPIPWQTFTDKSKTPAEWAAWVQNRVYEL
jgi:putative hemolysin